MSKTSAAFKDMSWDKVAKGIVIEFHDGSAWLYKAKPQVYSMLCRSNVSAGRYLNRVLKAQGGVKVLESRQARREAYWPGIAV